MTLSDIGEFGFVEVLRARFGQNLPSNVVVGIGDDVAVVDAGGSEYLLATCDAQVSGVHFPKELIPPYDLGCRIVEVNVSDIAAMGGAPKWALVGLNVPAQTSLKFLEDFYAGVNDSLSRAGAHLVGGNCARTREEMVIDLFLMGTVSRHTFVARKGASEGDLIFVTGTLGRARAGLEVVIGRAVKTEELQGAICDRARRFFFRPRARLIEGQVLARCGFVTAMIDISDGFLQDLRHLARENGLDAFLDLSRIPVDPLCSEVATAIGQNPLMWALTGGEDYELLFTVRGKHATDFVRLYEDMKATAVSQKQEELVSITAIGYFEKGEGRIFLRDETGKLVSSEVFVSGSGWDHFSI